MIDAGTALAEIRYGLGAILPEVYLLSLLVVLILLDVRGASRRQAAWLCIGAQLGLLGWLLYQGPPAQPRPALLGQVVQDATGWYLRLVLTASQLLTLFLTLQMAWPSGIRQRVTFFSLLVCLQLGLQVMVISQHVLSLFVGMELASLCSYVLVSYFRTERAASEAGVKYLLYGAFSSGIMLFGFSLLYGLTGTLSLAPGELDVLLQDVDTVPLLLALLFVFAGFAFKASLFPFHFWAPDAYEGGNWATATLLATGSKVAAFGLILRWMQALPPAGVWLQLLLALSAIAMVGGNIAAFTQTHFRRLMAYSGIAHAGLLLFASLQPQLPALQAALLLYLGYYVMMTGLAFLAGHTLARHSGQAHYTHWGGLARQQPVAVLGLAVALIALAGLPPTAGFMAKLRVFIPLWSWYQQGGSTWVGLTLGIAVLSTVLGVFYYLKPLIWVLLRPSTTTAAADGHDEPLAKRPAPLLGFVLLLLSLALLLLGVYLPPIGG